MDSDSQGDEQRANRYAFYFFMSTLAFSLLAGIWMLIQEALV